ncbi:MAG: hypothetical protein Harvfovirus1_56 [Harvfovirus sp.]|uniref:Uncharacterized protein n=1 Tax=Harvfovirus sp. TaxID=2487768 RepID=A0A3G5A2L2_9VIRU|nr:MAG: hypothetical protein Harvfovirus1_56 [Harvfovirus sp.]
MEPYYKKYSKYKTKYLSLKNSSHIDPHLLLLPKTASRSKSLIEKSSRYNKSDVEITTDLVPYNF